MREGIRIGLLVLVFVYGFVRLSNFGIKNTSIVDWVYISLFSILAIMLFL